MNRLAQGLIRPFFAALCLALATGAQAQTSGAPLPELALQIGHRDGVTAVAFSPDGRRLASGSRDGSIKLWETGSGQLLFTLNTEGVGANALAFSPDGRTLASGGTRSIELWDVGSRRHLRSLRGHGDEVLKLVFSRDGRRLASTGWDNTVRVWDVGQSRVMRIWKSGRMDALVFAADNRSLLGAGEDAIKSWDIGSGRQLNSVPRKRINKVGALAFSPDARLLVSASNDRSLALWTSRGVLLRRLVAQGEQLQGAAFSPDSRRLATASFDGSVEIWDVASGGRLALLKGHSQAANAVAFSPDGQTLASGGDDHTVKLWNASNGQVRRALSGLSDRAYALAFAPDGRTLASANYYDSIKFWDHASGQLRQTMSGSGLWVNGLAYSANGRTLASGGGGSALKVWDSRSARLLRTLNEKSGESYSMAYSADGTLVASGGYDGVIKLWKVGNNLPLRVLRAHTDRPWSLAFSPDGKRLASASTSRGNTTRLWDVKQGRVLRTWKQPANVVAFSPDGRTLSIGGMGDSGSIQQWDVSSNRLLRIISAHRDGIEALAYSSDGRTIASGSQDRTIKLWDSRSGRLLHTLLGHSDVVLSVAFSRDGRTLASSSWDSTIKLWDARSGGLKATLQTLPQASQEVRQRAQSVLGPKAKAESLPVADWFVSTPEGYFDCSASAARYVLWNVRNQLYPAQRYWKKFRRPDLVRRALAGEKLTAPRLTASDVPPLARFVRFEYEANQNSALVTVECRYAYPLDEKKAIRILVNNRPLPPAFAVPIQTTAVSLIHDEPAKALNGRTPIDIGDRAPLIIGAKDAFMASGGEANGKPPWSAKLRLPDPNSVEALYRSARRLTFRVPLPSNAREIALRAICYDTQGLGSAPIELKLRDPKAQTTKGNLYVICVGLSRYKNGSSSGKPVAGRVPNLVFPKQDATAVAVRLGREVGGLYKRVEIHMLLDERVTLANWQQKMEWLRKSVRPGQLDTVMVFFSGHGFSDVKGNYFFPTYAFDPKRAADTSLSGEAIQRGLGANLSARNVFLFVDTCHSGALSGRSDDLSFEVEDSGIYLMASSGATQRSYESKAWGHGAFTKALLTSLSNQSQARDGKIHFDTLTYLVPAEVARLLRDAGWNDSSELPVVPLEGRYLNEPVALARP